MIEKDKHGREIPSNYSRKPSQILKENVGEV